MQKPRWEFVLDDPSATDSDYENGTSDGRYRVYDWRGELIDIVETLDEAESLVEANRCTTSATSA